MYTRASRHSQRCLCSSQVQVRRDEACKVQCKLRLTASQAKDFQERIKDDYRVTMCACAVLMPRASG